MTSSGYQEFDHTADWGIFVWAEDLFGLLETAAKGMFDLLEVIQGEGGRSSFSFELELSSDHEKLLVDFLSELLYLSERDKIAFDRFAFVPKSDVILFSVSGYPIEGQRKEIKAVTYNDLRIQKVGNRLETAIVFDV